MMRSRQGTMCKTCNMLVAPDKQAEHDKSEVHERSIMLHFMSAKEQEFLNDKEGIRMICTNNGQTGYWITVSGIVKEYLDIEIEIHSDDYDVTLRKTVNLAPSNTVKILNPVEDHSVTIKKGSTFTLILRAHSDQQYSAIIALGFLFSRQGRSHIHILRYVRVSLEDATMQTLMPESPYVSVEPVAQLPPAVKIVKMRMSATRAFNRVREARVSRMPDENFVPGNDEEAEDFLVQTEAVRKIPLHMYFPAPTLKEIHVNKLEISDDMPENYRASHGTVMECLKIGIDEKKPENYGMFFHYLLSFEDIQQEADIRMYDKERAELIPYSMEDTERFVIEVEGLEEGRPSLLRFDKIYVRQENSNIEYEGYIDRVGANRIEVIMGPEFLVLFYESEDFADYDDEEEEDENMYRRRETKVRYGVRFTVSRKTMRLMYRSLCQYIDLVKTSPIDELLIPRVRWPAEPTTTKLDLKLVNQSIANNPEQLCAVRNIVLGLHRPLAYVLFGPPGTGKTTTITEAIIQVYKTLPESRILVVAPSNSAANVVTEKILKTNAIERSDLFRLCGITNSEHRVSPEIRAVSNWRNTSQQFEEVSMETIMLYRIVACTLSMSGVIVTLGIRRGFFTHIFIDEAGHAMEPEALIPLTGLLEPYDGRRVGGSVILSGDHLQLGPIIRSPIAKAHGMVKSLLERIMETKPYRRGKNDAYNPMILTKLVRNFRSHPKILEVPNSLFYDGELKAVGDKKITHSMVTYKKLPAEPFPLIFHGVFGREMRESNNPSFFNPDEITVILTYVRDLLSEHTKTYDDEPIQQSDIGIIAPYRKQVLKLRQFLRQHGYADITVGSTEEFQGQERLIMIISTVRVSQKVFDTNPGQSLGFLRNRKRFNVAVTRAKALMIVVGDPKLLDRDYCWKKLLRSCAEDKCVTGEAYVSNKKQYDDLFEQLALMEINLTTDHVKGMKLAYGGQITITDIALQEEPQWREDE